MKPTVLIVGQGLAGTLLGWELERAGIDFEIADAGHERAATRVAAGIINPITGRRLVKSAEMEALLPVARGSYREIERELGTRLWHDMRVRRWFVDAREREVFAEKTGRGELAPFAGAADDEGFWIEGAARVDLTRLVTAMRGRWKERGVLREERVDVADESGRYALVVDCRGAEAGEYGRLDWRYSKGECVELRMSGLDPAVVWNRRHWLVATGEGVAKAGATNEPGRRDVEVTAAARGELEASVRAMGWREFATIGQGAGVRVYAADKRPVIGRDPENARVGVLGGLGAKGALQAPALAKAWAAHVLGGEPIPAAWSVARFDRGPAAG